MASSSGVHAQGKVAFTEASQSAVSLRGGEGGPNSAASTPDRSPNEHRELPPLSPSQQVESKEAVPRQEDVEQEDEQSELGQPKVAVVLSAVVYKFLLQTVAINNLARSSL